MGLVAAVWRTGRAAQVVLVAALALAACTAPREDPGRQALSRARADSELKAAVARVGTRVCRDSLVGIAVREILRGTVVAVNDESIDVRIDEPGSMEHTIGGRAAAKGAIVSDTFRNWVPCRESRPSP
jgi:hypothetical protein